MEILLIEDNSADVRIIKEIVSHSSLTVHITVAGDGKKAVAILDDPLYRPDLIITDLMPKSSLPEVLRLCHAKGAAVVVFSASPNPSDKAEALELGAKEFVDNPCDLDEYTEAVWRMVGRWAKPPAEQP